MTFILKQSQLSWMNSCFQEATTYNTCPDMAEHLLMQGLGTYPGETLWHGSTPDRSTHDTAVSCSLWLLLSTSANITTTHHCVVFTFLPVIPHWCNTITTAHLTGVNHLIYYNICVSVHPFTTLPFTILVSYIKNERSHWIFEWTVTELFETAFNVYKLEVLREETLLLWQHPTN